MTRATTTKIGLAGIAALLALSTIEFFGGFLAAVVFLPILAWTPVDPRG